MNKLLTIKLDVTKIPKDRIFQGNKGKYIDLDIWINDEEDRYGNNASANIRQTKDELDAKTPKIYVGNGKTVFGFDGNEKPATTQHQKISVAATDDNQDEYDDIPF